MAVNIFICLVFAITILGFPLRFFDLSEEHLYLLTISKLGLFILIMLVLLRIGERKIDLLRLPVKGSRRSLVPAILILLLYLIWRTNADQFIYWHNGYLLLLLLFVVVLSAFAEELAFRVYLPMNMIDMGYSRVKAVIISSVWFGGIHGINIFQGGNDVAGVFNQVVFAFFIGILLTSIYFLSKSLLFVWVFHFGVNVPAALNRWKEQGTSVEAAQSGLSIGEQVLESLIFLLMMSPLFILSMFYLRKIWKNGRANNESGSDHFIPGS